MELLLDTQIYLWTIQSSPKLRPRARKEIEAASRIFVSAATLWEASIKTGLGKLNGDPMVFLTSIASSGFRELPVTAAHGVAVHALAPHHRDPFDRLLIAQAIAEGLHLLTTDELLGLYSDQVIVV